MEPFACIYIYAHSLTLIEECPGYGVKVISRWQYQCANIKFSDQSKYNIIFKKVVHKGGESEINYFKQFKILRHWQFQRELAILKICRCTLS